MDNKPEPIFPDGLMYKAPRENAPDFVKGSISVNIPKFGEFIRKHREKDNDWMNFDMKVSKRTGAIYLELNTWKPAVNANGTEASSLSQDEIDELATGRPAATPHTLTSSDSFRGEDYINPNEIPF